MDGRVERFPSRSRLPRSGLNDAGVINLDQVFRHRSASFAEKPREEKSRERALDSPSLESLTKAARFLRESPTISVRPDFSYLYL